MPTRTLVRVSAKVFRRLSRRASDDDEFLRDISAVRDSKHGVLYSPHDDDNKSSFNSTGTGWAGVCVCVWCV